MQLDLKNPYLWIAKLHFCEEFNKIDEALEWLFSIIILFLSYNKLVQLNYRDGGI